MYRLKLLGKLGFDVSPPQEADPASSAASHSANPEASVCGARRLSEGSASLHVAPASCPPFFVPGERCESYSEPSSQSEVVTWSEARRSVPSPKSLSGSFRSLRNLSFFVPFSNSLSVSPGSRDASPLPDGEASSPSREAAKPLEKKLVEEQETEARKGAEETQTRNTGVWSREKWTMTGVDESRAGQERGDADGTATRNPTNVEIFGLANDEYKTGLLSTVHRSPTFFASVSARDLDGATDSEKTNGERQSASQGESTFSVHTVELNRKDDFRHKYLRKLSHARVWLPRSRRSPSHQTVTIFDWDDTLLCTTFLNACCHTRNWQPAFDEHIQKIERHAKDLLELAMRFGRVFIITNAVEGWVEHSSQKYLPGLVPLLQKAPIISARNRFEAVFPGEYHQWKVQAFLEVRRQLNREIITNLISVGDSVIEMDAVHVMGKEFSQALVKTVKLRENPSPEELAKQLEVVSSKFESICLSACSLAIGLERTWTGGTESEQESSDIEALASSFVPAPERIASQGFSVDSPSVPPPRSATSSWSAQAVSEGGVSSQPNIQSSALGNLRMHEDFADQINRQAEAAREERPALRSFARETRAWQALHQIHEQHGLSILRRLIEEYGLQTLQRMIDEKGDLAVQQFIEAHRMRVTGLEGGDSLADSRGESSGDSRGEAPRLEDLGSVGDAAEGQGQGDLTPHDREPESVSKKTGLEFGAGRELRYETFQASEEVHALDHVRAEPPMRAAEVAGLETLLDALRLHVNPPLDEQRQSREGQLLIHKSPVPSSCASLLSVPSSLSPTLSASTATFAPDSYVSLCSSGSSPSPGLLPSPAPAASSSRFYSASLASSSPQNPSSSRPISPSRLPPPHPFRGSSSSASGYTSPTSQPSGLGPAASSSPSLASPDLSVSAPKSLTSLISALAEPPPFLSLAPTRNDALESCDVCVANGKNDQSRELCPSSGSSSCADA
ncbi:UNVERIFIED_CONTAM: hypothetical protein HHA_223870 [Hammondia hammondi]|eukprot:XP_008881771.1 hypothetical protein HHA_223870 [Hammondia hammondi]